MTRLGARAALAAAFVAAFIGIACSASDPALRAGIAEVEARPERARVTLRPLAEQGNEVAIAQICNAYGRSMDYQVGPAERIQAAAWCEHAAHAGDTQAQYVLGTFYASGIGIAQDREQALAWYQAAAGRGHAEARTAMRALQGLPAECKNWITNCRLF